MRAIIHTVGFLCLSSVVAFAQEPVVRPMQPQLQTQPAVHRAEVVRETFAINFPDNHTVSLKFTGTERDPKAHGEARVERKPGGTQIEMKLDNMRPAALFGGDFNTYVLWVASPEGQVQNVGEFVLDGDNSKLTASTTLNDFAMFVTAEPHYLVPLPSRFIVLDMSKTTAHENGMQAVRIEYRGYDGAYHYDRDTLAGVKEAKGPVDTNVKQAFTAVHLAKDAGADVYAKAEFDKAQHSLETTLALSQTRKDLVQMNSKARETVRLAAAAETEAMNREAASALQSERATNQAQMDELESRAQHATNEADRARIEAERSQLAAAAEANARVNAEQQAQIANQQALNATERAQDATTQAQEAKAQAAVEREKQSQLEGQLADANKSAGEAKVERQKAYDQMRDALSKIADTRETARGLIVDIPDILFDTNSSGMRAEGRENLSKIAGIVLATPGPWTISVEGYTDNVGSDDYNQDLSEKRADSVRNYLVSNGIAASSITAEGFGEAKPIAPNDSASERQRNRRVEIIIQSPGSASQN